MVTYSGHCGSILFNWFMGKFFFFNPLAQKLVLSNECGFVDLEFVSIDSIRSLHLLVFNLS